MLVNLELDYPNPEQAREERELARTGELRQEATPLQESSELLLRYSGLFDDGPKRSGLHIGWVNRHRCHATGLRVPEKQVAAFLMVFDKPDLLQGCKHLSGSDAGKPAHAATIALTWTSASTGCVGSGSSGTGSPALINASTKPSITSCAMATASA
jgi:hypothetical protein